MFLQTLNTKRIIRRTLLVFLACFILFVPTSRISFLAYQDIVTALDWSPDNQRLAVAFGSGIFKVINTVSGQDQVSFQESYNRVQAVKWSPDGTKIAIGAGDGFIRVINASTSQDISYFQAGPTLFAISWSPDGAKIVSTVYSDIVARSNTIRIWSFPANNLLSTLKGYEDFVLSAAWSPDGNYLATGGGSGDNRLIIWNSQTGIPLLTLGGHLGGITSVTWSPNGTRLASVDDHGVVRIWNTMSGQVISQFIGTNSTHSASWSPDNQRIVVDDNNSLRVLDATTGYVLNTLQTNEPIYVVAWSPDGTKLAYGGSTAQAISAPQLTVVPTQTPTPTATPSGAIQLLRLTALCSPNPDGYRIWRVQNPNSYQITFTWGVYQSVSNQTGSGVVPAANGSVLGETTFETVTEDGTANTVRLFVNGVTQDIKDSEFIQCFQTPTPRSSSTSLRLQY